MRPFLSLLLCCLVLVSAELVWAQAIRVTDAWIAEPPPGAKALAAYMIIGNGSSRPVRLQSASSVDFHRIELHRSMTENGMTHMKKQPHLEIAAGDSANLQPGGWHLMLFGPGRQLREGERVRLLLSFDDGETLEVQAEVRRRKS